MGIGRFETVQLLLSFSTIDTTMTFLSKTAIEWAEPNVKATEWKGWESLENRIDEAGRAKCLALLSSASLWVACFDGLLDEARVLLDLDGIDINYSDKDGRTSLYIASENGHIATVKLLIAKDSYLRLGLNVNQATIDDGVSPLWMASQEGHIDTTKALIEADANVNQVRTDNGISPLWVACYYNHHNIVRLLNQHNANINQPRHDGWTPLILMTYIGRFETVQLLLSFSTIDTTMTFLSKTAIEWAEPNVKATEWKGWESVENMIGAAGRAKCLDLLSSQSQSTPSTSSTFQGETKTQNVNTQKKKKKKVQATAEDSKDLYKACFEGQLDEVRSLLDLGGININDEQCGFTLLYIASQQGHHEIVQVLINAGGNVNQARTELGFISALFIAAQNGHTATVKVLLKAGGNVNQARTSDGVSPLFMASENGNVAIVKVLIKAGGNVNQVETENGASPFYMACENTHLTIVQLLNQHNANINQARYDGWTPFIFMTYLGRFETVQLLLSLKTIDTTIAFLSKRAIEWAETNARATGWKGWESLEGMINEAGRAKCLALLSSQSQSTSFQGKTKTENDNTKTENDNTKMKKKKKKKKKKKTKEKVQATAEDSVCLWDACFDGQLDEVRSLLDLDGIDIHYSNKNGCTFLFIAS